MNICNLNVDFLITFFINFYILINYYQFPPLTLIIRQILQWSQKRGFVKINYITTIAGRQLEAVKTEYRKRIVTLK